MTEAQTRKIEQYRKAFEKVQNPRDWKAPIDAVVPLTEADTTIEAIEFYTATKARILRWQFMEDGRAGVHIQADGYRAGPAGDH